MAFLNKWKIYCITEQQFNIVWNITKPTFCPKDTSHAVNLDSINSTTRVINYKNITTSLSPFFIKNFHVYRCICDTGDIFINLPDPNTLCANKIFIIIKVSSLFTIHILPSTNITIDNQSSYMLLNELETIKIKINNENNNWELVELNTMDGENDLLLEPDIINTQDNESFQTNTIMDVEEDDNDVLHKLSQRQQHQHQNGSRIFNIATNIEYILQKDNLLNTTLKKITPTIQNTFNENNILLESQNINTLVNNNSIPITVYEKSTNTYFVKSLSSGPGIQITDNGTHIKLNVATPNTILDISSGGTNNNLFLDKGLLYYNNTTNKIQNNSNLLWNYNTNTLNITGILNISGNKIINVNTPTNNTDCANKLYVDESINTLFKLWKFSDTRSVGTNGDTSIAGSWQNRPITTTDMSQNTHVSLNNNVITLLSGTYIATIYALFYNTGNTIIRLYDTTNNTIIGHSIGIEINDSSIISTSANFIVSSQITIQIQYMCSRSTIAGLGKPLGINNQREKFLELFIISK